MRIRYLPILLLTLVAVVVSYASAAQTAKPAVLPNDQMRCPWYLQVIYPHVEAWERDFNTLVSSDHQGNL